ncbi:MAG: hypothetical protein ACE5JR_11270 [Gemmatimonadota bacterium]
MHELGAPRERRTESAGAEIGVKGESPATGRSEAVRPSSPIPGRSGPSRVALATATPAEERLSPVVWIFGALMVVTAAVTLVLMLRDFSSQSYLYLAFYAIPSNAAISVFPHEPVVLYFGKYGSMWMTAAAASVGTLVAGFMDHTVFVPILNLKSLQGYKEKSWYATAVRWFMRYPYLTLTATGFVPVPFFPFKFLSFSIRYPMWKYLAALLTARFPRYLLLAWAGSVLEIPNWLLFGFFGLVILAYAIKAGPKVARRLLARRAEAAGQRRTS